MIINKMQIVNKLCKIEDENKSTKNKRRKELIE